MLGDTIGCEGDSLILMAQGDGDFSWDSTINGIKYEDVFTLNQDTIILTADNFCGQIVDTVQLVVIPTSLLDLGPDTTIFAGESIYFSSSLPGNYQWTPTYGIDCSTCSTVIFSPEETTTYILQIDTVGCISQDEIIINVEVSGDVAVPNLFTPNGDGVNDLLEIYGFSIDELDFRIYDRWGEVVFQTNSISDAWDGKFNGMELNTAVFVYSIKVKYKDGREVIQQGNITLVK